MTKNQEWWANVYPETDDDECPYGRVGNEFATRVEAELLEARMRAAEIVPLCRIHVRLKPEGAPKRYASEANQAAWERNPVMARALAEQGFRFEAEPRHRVQAYPIV